MPLWKNGNDANSAPKGGFDDKGSTGSGQYGNTIVYVSGSEGYPVTPGWARRVAGTGNRSGRTTWESIVAISDPVTGSATRVQQIASRSEQNFAISGALTSANQRSAGRSRFYFSHDCDNIQVGFNGYWVADANATFQCAETNLGNSYDVRCAVEYNGVSIAFTWNGGSSNRTVAAGEALALSDKLTANAFGLAKFTKGDQFWLRMERITPVGGNMLYHYANTNSPAITGERYFTANTSATDFLTATSDWPATNGWSASSVVWLPCAVIGEVSGNKMSTIVLGASIEHGAGDSGRGDGVNGNGGYVRRGFAVNKGARISLMKATETAASFVNNSTKRRVLFPYATHMYEGHGGNDYSYGGSVSATQTALSTIFAWGKSAGMKVRYLGLSVKTDSSNSWADQAGQTPRAGFEIGGNWRDAVHTWAAGKVGTEIDAFNNFDAAQSAAAMAGSRDKWRTDLGVPTTDGTHPSDVVHGAMATQLATIIESDRAAYEV